MSMKDRIIEDVFNRVLEELWELGGCDASDERSKGWDDAIDAAIQSVEVLRGQLKGKR